MSDESDFLSGIPADELASYLQLYLDETSEQLDALVETLLVLEQTPASGEHLNEAFRLIHSVKGSSAMMGFESITALTHHLENHFERLRSGLRTLDSETMGLILRCIDFLRDCQGQMRSGQPLASAPELLEELGRLNAATEASGPPAARPQPPAPPTPSVPAASESLAPESVAPAPAAGDQHDYRITVRFRSDLQLVDLKAELICNRLSELGEIRGALPPMTELAQTSETRWMQLLVVSEHDPAELHRVAEVEGVETVEVVEASGFDYQEPVASAAQEQPATPSTPNGAAAQPAAAPDAENIETKSRPNETVRVDIGRLDDLMNLAGELVVSKARFTQLARRMSPAFQKASMTGHARALGETLRRLLEGVEQAASETPLVSLAAQLREVEESIGFIEEQSRLWEQSRRHFGQLTEAIDQLARVSKGLQRGVLDTRMVPIGPLFNRFKRVVRDIAQDRGKKVVLEIRGEKTELDKRMIDELGDPLVHLVRNAIDHGIESVEDRLRAGKSETGVLRLEAVHSGNSVIVKVTDDGAGISIEKVRARAIERGLVSASAAASLSHAEVLDFIWRPGFSTAETVSDISGRGVGMDIVKTRIMELNGNTTIDVVPGRGTTFTIRLPLTLAIIRSLLFRVRYGVFAVPIENVREIVSVPVEQIVTIRERRTFDVRGEFIPLIGIDEIFDWHNVDYGHGAQTTSEGDIPRQVNVVILDSASRTVGLRVDELLGGQDIVIKSLADNFRHIRGLSGATILGDGAVSLLLDAGATIEMVHDRESRERQGHPAPASL